MHAPGVTPLLSSRAACKPAPAPATGTHRSERQEPSLPLWVSASMQTEPPAVTWPGTGWGNVGALETGVAELVPGFP